MDVESLANQDVESLANQAMGLSIGDHVILELFRLFEPKIREPIVSFDYANAVREAVGALEIAEMFFNIRDHREASDPRFLREMIGLLQKYGIQPDEMASAGLVIDSEFANDSKAVAGELCERVMFYLTWTLGQIVDETNFRPFRYVLKSWKTSKTSKTSKISDLALFRQYEGLARSLAPAIELISQKRELGKAERDLFFGLYIQQISGYANSVDAAMTWVNKAVIFRPIARKAADHDDHADHADHDEFADELPNWDVLTPIEKPEKPKRRKLAPA